jgi:hypothetical protein
MKVKEYIELLKQFPQDLEIMQEYDTMYFTPHEPEKMKIIKDKDTFLGEVVNNKENTIECVVI